MDFRAKEFVNVLDLLHEHILCRDTMLKLYPGLTRIDCFLLQFLDTTTERVTMNDLSEVLKVSHSRVTRIMDNLCKLNLAQRELSEEDRRCWYASLTPEGTELAQKIKMSLVEHQIEVLQMIPEDRLDEMLELLTIYANAFARVTKNNLNKKE